MRYMVGITQGGNMGECETVEFGWEVVAII